MTAHRILSSIVLLTVVLLALAQFGPSLVYGSTSTPKALHYCPTPKFSGTWA